MSKRIAASETSTPEGETPVKPVRTSDPVERARRQLKQQLDKALRQRNDDLAEHTRKIQRLEDALARLTDPAPSEPAGGEGA